MTYHRGNTPDEDRAFGTLESGTITHVERYEDSGEEASWTIRFGDCMVCSLPDRGVEPKVGDTLEIFGPWGRPIHGYALNGTVMDYSSREQMEAKHKAMVEEMDAQKKARFDERKGEADLKYDALLPEFKQRIDRFRAANPDFRWKYEYYEGEVCTAAVMLVEWARKRDGIKDIFAWNELSPEGQSAEIPTWSQELSGNQHQCAVYLASLYLTQPEHVVLVPGAMAPLLGSADYSVAEKAS